MRNQEGQWVLYLEKPFWSRLTVLSFLLASIFERSLPSTCIRMNNQKEKKGLKYYACFRRYLCLNSTWNEPFSTCSFNLSNGTLLFASCTSNKRWETIVASMSVFAMIGAQNEDHQPLWKDNSSLFHTYTLKGLLVGLRVNCLVCFCAGPQHTTTWLGNY